MRIAIFGSIIDPQVVRVTMIASERGHHVIPVPPELWQGHGLERHSLAIERNGRFSAQFGSEDPLSADAAWLRHLVPPFPTIATESELPPLDRNELFIEAMHCRERSATCFAVIDALLTQGKTVINPPAPGLGIQNKPTQLMTLGAAGVQVPDTLITDDPDAVRRFSTGRRVLFKPATGGGLAKLIDSDDLEKIDLIKRSPVIFQEFVPGDDVRITLVEDRIVSAVYIRSAEGTVDFRSDERYQLGQATYDAVELPEIIQQAALKTQSALGLRFSGIDVRYDAHNPETYAVLEANPSPTYYDIERKTGHAISEALVDALTR